MPPRRGINEFFGKCDKKEVMIVTSSDAEIVWMRRDLEESGIDLNRFDHFFKLDQWPYKDFSIITEHYGIRPRELLVIGDSDKDIDGAIDHKCCYLRVPEYFDKVDEFDLSKTLGLKFGACSGF